jgi:hypothetical protein
MQRTLTAVHLDGPDQFKKSISPWNHDGRRLYCCVDDVGAGWWWFVCMKAYIPNKIKTDVDEASDTYDWLVKNTDITMVLEFGEFHTRFYATYSLSRHPALKAVSPQACISDFLWWFSPGPIYWAIESQLFKPGVLYQVPNRVGNQRWSSVWTQDLCLTWMHFMEKT